MIVRRRDGAILRQLQTLYNLGTIGDLTDGQLLERFATDASEAAELAFSALVERHEAMVWRVCMAIVRDEHQAEDAFQATFLVLVRRARSLWVRDSLGPWLNQVACRTATCLRATVRRRRKHEQRRAARDAARTVEIETPPDPDRDAAVHEELNRLPEKYRAPVVLCDLEGRTHQEAARSLGWPIGTVKSRQSQGRKLLRDRLVRRGLGLAVAGAVIDSLRQAAVAAMPKEVARNAVDAAMRQSARALTGVGVPAHVLALTQGVLRTMFWIRLRSLTVAALVVGIATGGASVYVRGSQEPAKQDGQAIPKRTTDTSAKAPQPSTITTRARLRAQQLATRKARASYAIARATRELAEIAVEEYEEVTFPRDLATVEGEIKLAESNLKRSEDLRERARRKAEIENKRFPTVSNDPEKLSHQKAQFALEQAQSKRKVLVDYTRSKTINELRKEVEKARADERAKQDAVDIESIKERELEHLSRLKTD